MDATAPAWGLLALIVCLAAWFLLAFMGVCCCMLASRVSRQVEKWRGRD